jgi:hypothetical protein
VIEMPMTQKHRAMFNSGEIWARYHDHIHKLVQKAGGELVNASDWVQDEDFKDQLHVNSAGALSFTNRLAKWYQFRLEKKN